MFDPRERIDRIYRELGVPPDDEDVLVRWERMRPKPEPEPRERKLDPAPATLAEIEELIAERVAAEHERMMAIVAEVIAIPEEWMPAAPPGPPGPPGTPGAPGKLPIVKLWQPESVSYEAQVVSYGGATYQALRDTAQKPGGSDWICLAMPGRDAITPEVRGTYKEGEQGPEGPRGKLPIAKLWQPDSVTYEAQVVSYDGATYQALCDTAQKPGGSDWICLALPGRDAKSPRMRGTFSADTQYQELDIVAHGGGSFIARRNEPGPCPGDGWQPLTMPGERGERGPPGPPGAPGKLPVVKLWTPDAVFYQGDVVAFDGSTFQAICDTGQPPTHAAHWICLAVPGRDAKSPRVRGTFSTDAHYQELDIVAHGGGSFIARRNEPGPCCPGDGWQSLTMPGKRGEIGPPGPRGEKGPKGDQGPAGPIIATWEIDHVNYRARAIMSDGSDGGTLDLRSMFERYHDEVR